MRYGMNLLLWADVLSDEGLPLLDEIKEIGFDVARRMEQRRDALEAIQRGSATDLHETGRG